MKGEEKKRKKKTFFFFFFLPHNKSWGCGLYTGAVYTPVFTVPVKTSLYKMKKDGFVFWLVI